MLFILSEPSTCTCESIKKRVEHGKIVGGGNDGKGVNSSGWCNLTQPIAFQTWSDFLYECKYSKEIKRNPTNQVTVNLSLKPTRLLNVDPDKHVRNNFIEYWGPIINYSSH